MLNAKEIIESLGLVPHPAEGGYFRETYRSTHSIPSGALPAGYSGARSVSTAIYYLLTSGTCSRLHRVLSDEIFHFYLGDPVTMLLLPPDSPSEVLTLGQRIEQGHRLQVVVHGGTWQGCCLAEGGQVALMGTTVAPGFEYADYAAGDGQRLIQRYPERKDLILRLTP